MHYFTTNVRSSEQNCLVEEKSRVQILILVVLIGVYRCSNQSNISRDNAVYIATRPRAEMPKNCGSVRCETKVIFLLSETYRSFSKSTQPGALTPRVADHFSQSSVEVKNENCYILYLEFKTYFFTFFRAENQGAS